MFKKIGEALFFVLLGWLFWAMVMGSSPQERMDRSCTAVSGPGNFIASMANAFNNGWGTAVESGTVNMTYRCRMTLWTFFYGTDWAKLHPDQIPGQPAATDYSPLVVPGGAVSEPPSEKNDPALVQNRVPATPQKNPAAAPAILQ